MADGQQTVRSVSWNEVFSSCQIFKSFKMAIHPSKIVLALVAIALTCLFGWVTERIWTKASDSNWVQKDEAWLCWKADGRAAFKKDKQRWLENRALGLETMLTPYDKISEDPKEDFWSAWNALRDQYHDDYKAALKLGDEVAEVEAKRINGLSKTKEEKKAARAAAKEANLDAKRAALNKWADLNRRLKEVRGQPVFGAFLKWEMRCVANAIGAVARGNISSGLSDLYKRRGSMTPVAFRGPAVSHQTENIDASTNVPEVYGLAAWVVLMIWGVFWMLSAFPWYAIVFFLFSLAVWSIFGGAICRIAALHAARDEKIPMSAALKFGLSKFLSTFSAPVLPLAIITLLGLLLALGGLIGSIGYFGEWFVAVLFALALLLGAIMAFLALGLGTGWPLMWPTIAVEGSDGFDAISRSFSYVFARPFRYGLYWLVAAVYGAICYLFVRLFAFVVLSATHCCTGWAMKLAGKSGYAEGAGKLDVMWAAPKFWAFHGPMQFEAMDGSEKGA
ncbi:hypothetical protein LCGC14_2073860, partial [marine sediment metagenome]